MMKVFMTGRLFNGRAFDWGKDRRGFGGRMNFRVPRVGKDAPNEEKYAWIDVVCFNDFGDNGGIVNFMEENFIPEEGDTGGYGVEIFGYLKPRKRKNKITIDGMKNGKKVTKEFEGIYDSFDLIIEEVEFGKSDRTSESTTKKSHEIDDDDFEFGDDDVEDTDDTTEQEEESKETKKPANKKNSNKKKQKEVEETDEDNEEADFFTKPA